MIKLKSVIYLISMMTLAGCSGQKQASVAVEEQSGQWILGPFVRPEGVNPVISPQPTTFQCPMRKQPVRWEESDTFNPAATVKDGKIVVLYRAEDNSAQGIGKRTSRIGYAESTDGVTMSQADAPVLFPSEDDFKEIEWEGGCEDPRVAMTEDGLYVMLYTAWNRNLPRLAVATSRDLKNWTKHGLAFAKAYNGRFANIASKSASIVTGVKDGRLVIEKVAGKYFMYWGENAVCAATSDNLTDWAPVLNENNDLREIAKPRSGYFDSRLTECGPPAIKTVNGIVLLYLARTDTRKKGTRHTPQALIVQGSSCLTPTTLIKYSTAWINLSLCPKPLSRRAVSTRTEQCLSKDWLTLKTNYISIMAVPIRRLQ